MRLDPEFARTLLQKIGHCPEMGAFALFKIEGHSEEKTTYHIIKAGLIEATDLSSLDPGAWKPKWLTCCRQRVSRSRPRAIRMEQGEIHRVDEYEDCHAGGSQDSLSSRSEGAATRSSLNFRNLGLRPPR